MACSGCKRRQQNLLKQLDQGMRTTSEVMRRIKRSLGSGDQNKDLIHLTADGVIKKCRLCQKQSDPYPTAGQVPPLTCDQCNKG